MNGSSRTESVFARAVAGLLFLTFVGSVGLTQVPAAADPNQGVLLDGSTDASDVFYIAFASNGLQFTVMNPPAQCPSSDHVLPPGTYQGSREVEGVYQPDQSDGRGFVVSPPLVATTLPVNLADLYDDCEVAEQLSDVLSYLDQAYLEAMDLVDQIDVRVQDATDAYCHLVEVIGNAETFPHAGNLIISGLPFHLSGSDYTDWYGGDSPPECVEFLVIHESLPQALDSMEHDLSACEAVVSKLNTRAAEILTDGFVRGTHEDVLAVAGKWMSQAEEVSTRANARLNEISQLSAQIGLPEVEESCEECAVSPPEDPLIPLSGAVLMQTGRTPLDRYVTAFYEAASDTSDPDLALRLSDIALRLEEIPDGRVLHLTFATTSSIGQDYLALHPADAPDDGDSPLVVLLTAVNPDPPLPPMNAADERLLFDGFWAFLVRVGCTTPGCIGAIPAVSKWGLVVMTLLLLTGVTIKLNRRQPAHG